VVWVSSYPAVVLTFNLDGLVGRRDEPAIVDVAKFIAEHGLRTDGVRLGFGLGAKDTDFLGVRLWFVREGGGWKGLVEPGVYRRFFLDSRLGGVGMDLRKSQVSVGARLRREDTRLGLDGRNRRGYQPRKVTVPIPVHVAIPRLGSVRGKEVLEPHHRRGRQL
jgi:hypothetical protein